MALTKALRKPLPTPHRCWEMVTFGFVTTISRSDFWKDAALVLVDKMSKQTILFHTHKEVTAEVTKAVLGSPLFPKYRDSYTLVSDRDAEVKSLFWRSLIQLLNMSDISLLPTTRIPTGRVNT